MSDRIDLMARVCPVCGREVKVLYGGMCESCYYASRRLIELPSELEVSVCRVCSAYRIEGKGGWRKPRTRDPVGEAVKAAVKKGGVREGIRSVSVNASRSARGIVRVRVVGSTVERATPRVEEHEVAVRIRWMLCADCVMAKSKREAARIQVRARGRPLTSGEVEGVKRIVEQSLSTRRRGSIDLVEVLEEEGGIDLIFSSLSSARLAANALARKLFASLLETRKAAGVVSGKQVAKLTVRILLPGFRAGDVIEFDGKLYYVLEIARSGVRALSLEAYKECSFGNAKALIERSRVVSRREELEPAVVASVAPASVDLVLLRSQKTVSLNLERSLPWLEVGGQVLLAEIGGRLRVLPSR